MSNEKLLEHAIETLRNIDLEKTEGISIETNNYEDGSSYLSINVDFKKGV